MKITNMKNLKESSNVNSEFDIDEQVRGTNILSQIGGAKNFKGLSKTLQAAFKDMEIAIGLQKNPIMLGSKELKTTDDIFLALKDGSLVKNAKELGRVEKGLLKSVNTDPALRKAIAVDFASDKTILAQFARENKTNAKEIKEFLKSKGYPDSSINEIIAQMKKNGNMDSKGLFTVKGSSKVTPPPPPPPVPKSLLSRTKELLNNIKIKKMSWRQLLAWGAGIGVGAVALWIYIKNNIDETPEGMPETQPKDDVNGEWGECLNDIIKSNDGRLTTTNRGSSVVLVNPTDKYPKGLVFYSNNRVQNLETRDMGTWTCKGSTAVIAESINDVVKRVLKEKLLNEQSVPQSQMDKAFDTVIWELDGWVDTDNLKNVYNLLLSLKGKTFEGKDAIQYLSDVYAETEDGTLLGDVESVGVKTLDHSGVQTKTRIISLLSGTNNVTNTPNVQTPKKVTINEQSSIDISWDKDKKAGGGNSGGGKKSSYRNCEDEEFPLSYGCKSSKIAEVQRCLGVADDGKLGPKTMKAISDNKYDTSRGLSKDVYDAIKTNCVPVEKRREKIEPINLPVRGLDMSSLAPGSIKLPDLSKMIQMNPQPMDLYQVLKDAGYIVGDSRSTVLDDGTTLPATKRVKYKGPDLENEILSKLDEVMLGLGYDRIKQKLDKRYGEKYVWLQK